MTELKEIANKALTEANEQMRIQQYDKGVEILKKAIEEVGDLPEKWVLHFNLGAIYSIWGKYEEALHHFLESEEDCNQLPLLYHNIGLNYKREMKYEEAIKWYKAGINKEPVNSALHNNLATCLIALGKWKEGFKEWEWRLLAHQHSRKVRKLFDKPDWDGTEGEGTILIYNEQGRGDMIQYSRYIRFIKEKFGYDTLLFVRPDMYDLMRECGATKIMAATEDAKPKYDLVCSVNSLPHFFGTTVRNVSAAPCNMHIIPKRKPPVKAGFWKEFEDKFKVGICWAGSAGHPQDIYRSVCNAQFSVFQHDNLQMFSVQKKDPRQVALIAENYEDMYVDMEDHIENMNDVALILEKMDLVIAVDTSIAHLAASLGIDTWVAIPKKPDYRWMLKKKTTPWYPTMRLFRQTEIDDWNAPFNEMAKKLKKLILG